MLSAESRPAIDGDRTSDAGRGRSANRGRHAEFRLTEYRRHVDRDGVATLTRNRNRRYFDYRLRGAARGLAAVGAGGDKALVRVASLDRESRCMYRTPDRRLSHSRF